MMPAPKANDVLVKEEYGTNGHINAIAKIPDGGRLIVRRFNGNRHRLSSGLGDFLKSAFLPQGYPESVSEDYLEYQIWDTIQAFCSSITGTLAMQAMLKGYGVGDKTATAAGATVTWMLKDGAGMVGRIAFAWLQGTQLDCDAKRWRLFADILNDCAIMLELIAPIFRTYFWLIACFAGVAKSIVGVAGGATRAALTQHQARRDNMADVSAKDGSQETLVNLMALLAGFIITPMVANNQSLVWFLFLVFTFLHLFANYRAVSAVVMETVNLPRLYILLVEYLNSGRMLSPKQVSKRDPVIRGPGYRRVIKLGTSLTKLISCDTLQNFEKKKNYMVKIIPSSGLGRQDRICVALHRDITTDEIFQSGILALLIDAVLEKRVTKENMVRGHPKASRALHDLCVLCSSKNGSKSHNDVIEAADDVTSALFSQFLKGMEACGWNVTRTHFGPDEWRYVWPEDVGLKKEI